MRRRTFLKDTAIGVAAFAGGALPALGATNKAANANSAGEVSVNAKAPLSIGRPVRVVSIGFEGLAVPLDKIVPHVEAEGARGTDVILLQELCRGLDATSEESLEGPTVKAMSALAAKHRTYIAAPIDRRNGKRRFNTVVLLDRNGHIVSLYNKLYPYWSEYDVHPPISPGNASDVYEADFGRVGIATCFDANFPEVWRRLSEMNAELVLWPSQYSGGTSLQAHALNHHYYIVSSTAMADCNVYDITGERLLYEKAPEVNISRVSLDLDRGIYHENFNLEKRDKLLKEHSEDVVQEQWLHQEQWFVLKAKRPGVSARALARQYGLEELRHYIERSRAAIDKKRGWEFDAQNVFPEKSVGELRTLAPQTQTSV